MKILLADPRPEVRSALQLTLSRIPAVSGINEAGSLLQLMTQCAQSLPDLILFDLDLLHPSRAQTLADVILVLRRLCPAARLVVMSSRFEAEQQVLAAGADGFISKTDPPDVVRKRVIHFLENCD